MKINVLPSEIANMIAAGEVVERPASVIKELVENSIDAGATSVTVEIKKGGIPYMRISDNGHGIEAEDMETAFKRHATSKIQTASDLDAIGTLGFRGEALASIAAVARVEVFSKTAESDIGRCVTVEAGQILENDEAGCPDGTTMIVRNLFFNTPARMKFLKNDSTETGYVTEVMNKLILSHPEISFKYINNGKSVMTSSGDGKLISSIYTVFGKDYAKNMTEVSYSEPGFKVSGFVGNSYLARKDRRHQIFFVNSRNILSKIMSAAVSEAYKNTVMTGRFPVCVLKAEVDPKTVDVNVHPAKIEVRFADDKKAYNMIYWAIKNALTDKKYIPEFEIKSTTDHKDFSGDLIKNAPDYKEAEQINLLKESYVVSPSFKKEETKKAETSYKPIEQEKNPIIVTREEKVDTSGPFFAMPEEAESIPERLSVKEDSPKSANPIQEPEETKKPVTSVADGEETSDVSRFNHVEKPANDMLERRVTQHVGKIMHVEKKEPAKEKQQIVADVDFKLIGQAFGTYILIQVDNELLVIDQHAAHERLYFEELVEEYKTNSIDVQMMLLPVTMTLTPSETDIITSNKGFFALLGFEIEEFGSNSIIVRTTPGTMEEQDIKDCITETERLLSENRNDIRFEMCEEALHMIACKKALKGNKTLSIDEMKRLCERVLSLGDGINTCPHGRPIMIKMSKYSLEKQFKRIV